MDPACDSERILASAGLERQHRSLCMGIAAYEMSVEAEGGSLLVHVLVLLLKELHQEPLCVHIYSSADAVTDDATGLPSL